MAGKEVKVIRIREAKEVETGSGKTYLKVTAEQGEFTCWKKKLWPELKAGAQVKVVVQEKDDFQNIVDIEKEPQPTPPGQVLVVLTRQPEDRAQFAQRDDRIVRQACLKAAVEWLNASPRRAELTTANVIKVAAAFIKFVEDPEAAVKLADLHLKQKNGEGKDNAEEKPKEEPRQQKLM